MSHPNVRARVQTHLDQLLLQSTGSSSRVVRALLAEVPPSLDAGEVTDKGSINQRAVLKNRAALVAELYEEPPSTRVVSANQGK